MQKAVASVDWRVLKTAYEARGARPFLHLVEAGTRIAPTPEAATADATPALLRAWADAASADRPAIVTAFVRHAVARALGVGEGHPIDDRQGLFEMGMDSLMSIELKGRLEAAVGRPLPSTLTFNYPSVEALAGYLTHDVLAEEETEQPPPSAPAAVQTESESDARAPDELSEDELAARIAAKLARLH